MCVMIQRAAIKVSYQTVESPILGDVFYFVPRENCPVLFALLTIHPFFSAIAVKDGEWRKIDSCKNCKGARTLHWPPILPVARKPRFFCNTFFHKNEKNFWRISAIF